MKESMIQTLFSKANPLPGAYELKLEKGKRMLFNKVKPHQVDSLYKAKHDGLFHKITDQPIFSGMKTRFNKPKPFDCLMLKGIPAYVAICYYTPRQKKEVICIDIDFFILAQRESGMKSLTEEDAKLISDFIITL